MTCGTTLENKGSPFPWLAVWRIWYTSAVFKGQASDWLQSTSIIRGSIYLVIMENLWNSFLATSTLNQVKRQMLNQNPEVNVSVNWKASLPKTFVNLAQFLSFPLYRLSPCWKHMLQGFHIKPIICLTKNNNWKKRWTMLFFWKSRNDEQREKEMTFLWSGMEHGRLVMVIDYSEWVRHFNRACA